MANRLTRVPDRPVPALPRWTGPALVAADFFMILMASRPATGSLRRTWVTPATLWMCLAALAGCAAGMAALSAAGADVVHPVSIGLRAGLLALAVGAGAVGLVGVEQRRA